MPKLYDFLHYRVVDVSTIKEISKRWLPELKNYEKMGKHRAIDDIRESIEEMRYYKTHIFDKVKNLN